jgi:hypothetical protein
MKLSHGYKSGILIKREAPNSNLYNKYIEEYFFIYFFLRVSVIIDIKTKI